MSFYINGKEIKSAISHDVKQVNGKTRYVDVVEYSTEQRIIDRLLSQNREKKIYAKKRLTNEW